MIFFFFKSLTLVIFHLSAHPASLAEYRVAELFPAPALRGPCPGVAVLEAALAKLPAHWFAKQTSASYYLPWQVPDQIDDL